MRLGVEKTYSIPPELIVGSRGKLKFEFPEGKPVVLKPPQIDLVDDGRGKPDGDLQMLPYMTGGEGPRFGLIGHHTDAEREYACDCKSYVGRLDKALDEAERRGWTVVDRKAEWKVIFPAKGEAKTIGPRCPSLPFSGAPGNGARAGSGSGRDSRP